MADRNRRTVHRCLCLARLPGLRMRDGTGARCKLVPSFCALTTGLKTCACGACEAQGGRACKCCSLFLPCRHACRPVGKCAPASMLWQAEHNASCGAHRCVACCLAQGGRYDDVSRLAPAHAPALSIHAARTAALAWVQRVSQQGSRDMGQKPPEVKSTRPEDFALKRLVSRVLPGDELPSVCKRLVGRSGEKEAGGRSLHNIWRGLWHSRTTDLWGAKIVTRPGPTTSATAPTAGRRKISSFGARENSSYIP